MTRAKVPQHIPVSGSDPTPADSRPVEGEQPPGAEARRLSPEEQRLVAALVEDGLAIQDRFEPEPLFRDSGRDDPERRGAGGIRSSKGE